MKVQTRLVALKSLICQNVKYTSARGLKSVNFLHYDAEIKHRQPTEICMLLNPDHVVQINSY